MILFLLISPKFVKTLSHKLKQVCSTFLLIRLTLHSGDYKRIAILLHKKFQLTSKMYIFTIVLNMCENIVPQSEESNGSHFISL